MVERLEKHQIAQYNSHIQSVANAPASEDLTISPKSSKKSVTESKKTNELAVAHFSAQVPQKAKSMLTYSVNVSDLSTYTSSAKLFKEYADSQTQLVAHEVKAARADKKNEEHWASVKHAFNERLKSLELKRQKNLSRP